MNVLGFRDVQAWLQDRDGNHLPLGLAIVDGNQITTVIEVNPGLPKQYHLHWRTSEGTPRINAWCEVFRPLKRKGVKSDSTVRIANHYMSADNVHSQSRSTRGRLELPLQRDSWLQTPSRSKEQVKARKSKKFISLSIKRLRTAPVERKSRDKQNPGALVYSFDMDMFDDDETEPFVIFRFEFKPNTAQDPQISPGPGLRTSPRKLSLQGKKTSRALSPEISELSSSESEPEVPPSSAAGTRPKGRVQIHSRSTERNKRQRADSDSDGAPAARDVDAILKKRKTMLQRQQELRDTKERKRARREELAKKLEDETKALAEKLAEEEKEAEEIERDIERMEAALQAN